MDALEKYLESRTVLGLAKDCRISPTYMSDLRCNRKRVPSLKLAITIEDATDGAVPVRHWIDRQEVADAKA